MSRGLAPVGLLDQPVDAGHLDQPPCADGNGFKLAIGYQFVGFGLADAQDSRSVRNAAKDAG